MGNIIRRSRSIRTVSASHRVLPTVNATEMPSTASTVTAAAATTRPEITTFARTPHLSFAMRGLLLFENWDEAAVSAPSPSRRRKRLGTWKARMNALATQRCP